MKFDFNKCDPYISIKFYENEQLLINQMYKLNVYFMSGTGLE